MVSINVGTVSAAQKCLPLSNGNLCANVIASNPRTVVVSYEKKSGGTIVAYFGYRSVSQSSWAEESAAQTLTTPSFTAHPFHNNQPQGCVNAYLRVDGQGTFTINSVCP